MIEKYGDLSIIPFGGRFLTVACDSCGGIGALQEDVVKTGGFEVGYHTAFVALAETLAIRAVPLLIVDTLSVSLDDYGTSILNGIKAAATEAGLDPDISITGSSEENFQSASTGIGITVIGQLTGNDFPPNPIEKEYSVILLGIPSVGKEVLDNKSGLLTLGIIKTVLKNDFVLDLVPIGSKGILYEAQQLAIRLNLKFLENVTNPDMLYKSAGPATCAIAVIQKDSISLLENSIRLPITKIGTYINKK